LLDLGCEFDSIKVGMTEQISRVETFVSQGFASLQHTAAATQQQAQAMPDPRGVDPFTVHAGDWSRGRKGAEQVYVGTPVGRESGPPEHGRAPHQRWAVYDEKYVPSGKGIYDKAWPQVWLQLLHNYMAGRTEDMDRVLDWVEAAERDPEGSVGRLASADDQLR